MKFSLRFTLSLFAVLTVMVGTTKPSFAESDDSIVVCAEVMACAEDGSVLPQFQGGACEEVYAAQCRLAEDSEKVGRDDSRVATCRSNARRMKNSYEKKIASLQRQVRSLQRTHR